MTYTAASSEAAADGFLGGLMKSAGPLLGKAAAFAAPLAGAALGGMVNGPPKDPIPIPDCPKPVAPKPPAEPEGEEPTVIPDAPTWHYSMPPYDNAKGPAVLGKVGFPPPYTPAKYGMPGPFGID